ncbi:hypothetical protein C1H46_021465 [Malus baccata]|uniref:EF-hand domain-containing protein n=1 Tax=Malus baccata TaxID=106549 RepID=A0A540M2L2_MALBA|nr:hypothetical protein C1H46_021465 [Malus baccata]
MKTSSASAVVVHALNNLTVTGFVEDTTTFEKCSKECFGKLDMERFDADKNGVIDGQECKTLLAETMLAVAWGIGGSPVLVALEHGSLLVRAAEHEKAKKMQIAKIN